MDLSSIKFDNIALRCVDDKEVAWLNSLNKPFNDHHILDDGSHEVFMLDPKHHHQEFNPFCSIMFYFQTIRASEYYPDGIYYINYPIYKPTGTFSIDHGAHIITCIDGYMHNSSGDPAMASGLFGQAYYLHGTCYEAIEYFKLMEDQRKNRPEWFYCNYPDYDQKKYIEYMSSILGSKS